MHVQLTGRAHRTYRAKVEGVLGSCEQRLEWLKKGSRQLFGTLLESKVVVAIDSSSSVKERLCLIKDKVQELLQVCTPLHHHYVVIIITSLLHHHHYITITPSSVHHQYITITSPLH